MLGGISWKPFLLTAGAKSLPTMSESIVFPGSVSLENKLISNVQLYSACEFQHHGGTSVADDLISTP